MYKYVYIYINRYTYGHDLFWFLKPTYVNIYIYINILCNSPNR